MFFRCGNGIFQIFFPINRPYSFLGTKPKPQYCGKEVAPIDSHHVLWLGCTYKKNTDVNWEKDLKIPFPHRKNMQLNLSVRINIIKPLNLYINKRLYKILT